MISFEDINPENWRLELRVAKSQRAYVSDSAGLLARAYAYRNYRSKALVIKNDDEPVGMALYYDYEPLNAYDFSQLFIDERYQGKGYGMEAAEKIIEMMKADGKYNRIILCYIEGNDAAYELYRKCGFRLTGEKDEDEVIMELTF